MHHMWWSLLFDCQDALTWQTLPKHMRIYCFNWWLQWFPCLPYSGFHCRTSLDLFMSCLLCMTTPCMFVLSFAVDRFAQRLVETAVPVWTWPFHVWEAMNVCMLDLHLGIGRIPSIALWFPERWPRSEIRVAQEAPAKTKWPSDATISMKLLTECCVHDVWFQLSLLRHLNCRAWIPGAILSGFHQMALL